MCQNPMKEESKLKIDARFELSMPNKPSHNFLVDRIDGLELFMNFFGFNVLLRGYYDYWRVPSYQ